MVKKMPTHCGDDTCSSCVIAGDYIFLAHHGGGQDVDDIVHQTRATLESMAHTLSTAGATLDDVVQLNFYVRRCVSGIFQAWRAGADDGGHRVCRSVLPLPDGRDRLQAPASHREGYG